MRRSDSIADLAKALAAAQGEFQAVPREADNPFFKSKYADLPAVVMAASPILSKHGLSVSQLPDFDGTNDLLTTTIMHESGQWLEASARLHLIKSEPQAQGSATTYMRRYAFAGGVGIVTEADDDAEAASGRGELRKGAKASSKPASKPQSAPAPTANGHLDKLRTEIRAMLADIPADKRPSREDMAQANKGENGPENLHRMVKRIWQQTADSPKPLPPILVGCPQCDDRVPTSELQGHLRDHHAGDLGTVEQPELMGAES